MADKYGAWIEWQAAHELFDAEVLDHLLSTPPTAPAPQPDADDWHQYATAEETTAQQVIERHRSEQDALMRLLADARRQQPEPVNARLLEAMSDLLEAVESMRGTYGEIRGETPEDADTHTHDKWAEEFLREREQAARAAIAAAEAPRCQCGAKLAADCPEPWEPGCDLGNNEAYARVFAPLTEKQIDALQAEVERLTRELDAQRVYARVLCRAVDAATDFAGTVAGGASWWNDVWSEHESALDAARSAISDTAKEQSND